MIFVDDKSTDASANMIKDYSDEYDNVKVICLDENSGFAGRPRNIGIENATSDYLMFLDIVLYMGIILCHIVFGLLYV